MTSPNHRLNVARETLRRAAHARRSLAELVRSADRALERAALEYTIELAANRGDSTTADALLTLRDLKPANASRVCPPTGTPIIPPDAPVPAIANTAAPLLKPERLRLEHEVVTLLCGHYPKPLTTSKIQMELGLTPSKAFSVLFALSSTDRIHAGRENGAEVWHLSAEELRLLRADGYLPGMYEPSSSYSPEREVRQSGADDSQE